jgi:hypothetical protein
MFAEAGEEQRLCEIVDSNIAAGVLNSTKGYESFKAKFKSIRR